jgi:hypothetical protein
MAERFGMERPHLAYADDSESQVLHQLSSRMRITDRF